MFDKLTKEQLSYMIGLFHGDGSLHESTRNRGKLTYEISIIDKDIIDKLVTILSPFIKCNVTTRTRDTNFKDNYESIILTIHSKEFRDELKKYMPSGHKSKNIAFVETLSMQDYIRGLSDADGSLGLTDTRCFWSLCTSSESVKNMICKHIYKLTGLEKRINRNTRDGVYNIVIYNEDARTFVEHLYKKSTIYIKRKHDKLNQIQTWTRTVPKRKGRSKSWLESEDKLIQDNSYSLKEKMELTGRTAQSIKTRLWRLNKK